MSRLSEIRSRAEAATPAPWTVEYNNDVGYDDEGFWAWYDVGPAKVDIPGYEGASTPYLAKDNAAFIAAARTDVPYLVDMLTRAAELLRHSRNALTVREGVIEIDAYLAELGHE